MKCVWYFNYEISCFDGAMVSIKVFYPYNLNPVNINKYRIESFNFGLNTNIFSS